jgi:TetR/AcrR family transcriptional regulator, transcriptional repressor for nem operon
MAIAVFSAPVETTRNKILLAAREEMYEHGYQGLRIDAVLRKTQLAKGALYHYFPNKLALGYAILDEVIMGDFQQGWSEFLKASNDPLFALQALFKKLLSDISVGACFNGCPLTNLIQEMSTLDAGFQQRLRSVLSNIINLVAEALIQGQKEGVVRKDVNPITIAKFLLSSYQGIMSTAKCMQSMELAEELFGVLTSYVDALRDTDIVKQEEFLQWLK